MNVGDKPVFLWDIDSGTRDPKQRFFRTLIVAASLSGNEYGSRGPFESFMDVFYRRGKPNRFKYADLFEDLQNVMAEYGDLGRFHNRLHQPAGLMLRAGDWRDGWDRMCEIIDRACRDGLQSGSRGPTYLGSYWRYGNDGPIAIPSYGMFKRFVEEFDAGYHCTFIPGYRRDLDGDSGDKASDPARAENARMRERITKDSGFPYRLDYGDYLRYLDTARPKLEFESKAGWIEAGAEELRNLCLMMDGANEGAVDHSLSGAHTYVVGRSGSGKTELLKAIFYRMSDVTKVVVDPHGDLADDLADPNAYWEQVTLTVAPLERRFVINPFDLVDKSVRSVDLAAEEIVQLVCDLVEDVGLSRQMKLVAFPIVRTLLRLPYADFRMFAECLNPESGTDRLASISHAVDDADLDVWGALMTGAYDTTKRSVYSRLRSILNSSVVLETLCGTDDFGPVMEAVESENMNLLFSIPIPDMGEEASQTLGKFFMTRMQIWAKRRRSVPKEERTPVLLIVDEFQNFLGSATANTLDQFGRKFGLFMVLAHQHISQLSDKDIKGSVLANCRNKIAGMADRTTRKAIADEIGIAPEELETLGTGWWYGTFADSPLSPFRFYMIPAPESSEDFEKNYSLSANGECVEDGWALAGIGENGTSRMAAPAKAGTAKASAPDEGAAKKPAFDL